MKKILSGSSLKMIAITTMGIDHVASHILRHYPEFHTVLIGHGHQILTPYILLRGVGRLAFPIFAFLIVEGFLHTRNRLRYGRNLLLFALISELPFNYVHKGTWHCWGQNVFFTLLLGYLGLWAIEYYRNDMRRLTAALLGLLAGSLLLHADYGVSGFAFIIMLYTLRRHRLLQAIVGCAMLPMKWVAGLAFIPINMYNGRRGFIGHSALLKYAFYAFYPAHLLLLYFLKRYLFG